MTQRSQFVLLLALMGLFIEAVALDAWLTEVSCYSSNKYSRGGCLFGEDARMAAIFIAWIGLAMFVPLLGHVQRVKYALMAWLIGVLSGLYWLLFIR